MIDTVSRLHPAEASRRLGVSRKALRLYEQRGLIAPLRTASGWRTYGPDDMARAREIVALRALGLGLEQIEALVQGDPDVIEPTLAAHQAVLEGRARELADTVDKIRALRSNLAKGRRPPFEQLMRPAPPATEVACAFDLPWPWGGERFELCHAGSITYITGPLGSGKTRFARKIAESLPGGVFWGAERSEDGGEAIRARMDADPALRSRVDRALNAMKDDGAVVSKALATLLVALELDDGAIPVIDMVEQGLDQPSQEALMAYLRRRHGNARMVFLLTRSRAILDLDAVGAEEAIFLCPANHSPPTRVWPYAGTPGYEAVATCLAAPEIRARAGDMIAVRRQVA